MLWWSIFSLVINRNTRSSYKIISFKHESKVNLNSSNLLRSIYKFDFELSFDVSMDLTNGIAHNIHYSDHKRSTLFAQFAESLANPSLCQMFDLKDTKHLMLKLPLITPRSRYLTVRINYPCWWESSCELWIFVTDSKQRQNVYI